MVTLPLGAQDVSLSLDECLSIGLERNYSVRIARGEQRIAENNAAWGNAGFLPTVGLTSGYNASLDATRTAPREGAVTTESGVLAGGFSTGLDVSWTIFNGMSVQTNWRRLRELEAMGELAARITIEDFVASLTAEYYNYIQQTIRLRNYRYAATLSSERLRIAEARYLLGNGSRPELLQARVDHNADSSLYITQKERIATARIRLNEIMAADEIDREFAVRDSIIAIDEGLQLGELHDRMLTSSAELARAARSATVAGLDAKMVASRAYPFLRLSAGYGYAANSYSRGVNRRRDSWGPDAGLTFGFTIFDGNRRREIRNARIAADNAALRTAEIETALRADLATFWQAYRNNLQLLELERENVVSARQNYEAARDLYMTGVMAGIELREAQMSLLDGEERLLTALYNTKMCEISLLQVSGRV
ncbi:MAG: TolC family protein, partial [Alistipes sp.]|nr:TolC family protein [Alistipes sp.]